MQANAADTTAHPAGTLRAGSLPEAPPKHGLLIENQSNGNTICSRAVLASSMRARVRGLLGRSSFEPGEGLLIRPSSAVHTLGMSVTIDAVALDRHGRVLATRAYLKPGSVAVFSWRTKSILELPAGQIARSRTDVGDQLKISESTILAP